MSEWFTESGRATIIHHHYRHMSYVGLTVGLEIRNCNESCQCDNGLNGDSGNLCMATSVANYLVQTNFEGKIFLRVQLTHENITSNNYIISKNTS